MDQQRLFRLMPEAIDITIAIDSAGGYLVVILDRPVGVPWALLEPQRYEQLSGDEALDVICAHLSSLA